MKILLINFATGIPTAGPTYRTHHLAEFWAAQGHEVTYVATAYSHLLKEATPVAGPFGKSSHNGVNYIVLKAPSYAGSGVGRMRNILTCLGRLSRLEQELTTELRPDIVIAATVYQLDNFSALRIARKCGAAFVRETRDLWPLTLTELGGHSRWHPFVLWVAAAERLAYRHANLVVSTLENSLAHMRRSGLTLERWRYLPQCPAPSDAALPSPLPELHRDALAQARSQGRLVALFAGSLVPANQLFFILQAAALVRNEPVHLFLVGRGPLEQSLREEIARQGLANVTLLPAVEKGAMPALLAQADIGLAALGAHSLYRFGISLNKVFDYLAAGKPVILAADAPGNAVAAGGGINVSAGDSIAFAEAIRKLAAMSPAERESLGARGRQFVHQHHDFGRMALEYLASLEASRASPIGC